MEKFLNNLKAQAEANPLGALIVTTALLTAAGKFIDAAGHNAGSRAYARQVDHRLKRMPLNDR